MLGLLQNQSSHTAGNVGAHAHSRELCRHTTTETQLRIGVQAHSLLEPCGFHYEKPPQITLKGLLHQHRVWRRPIVRGRCLLKVPRSNHLSRPS